MLKFENDYNKQVQTFILYLENILEEGFSKSEEGDYSKMEELYSKNFVLSFDGVTLDLPFAAIEYDSILDCLKRIKEENEG